MFIDKIMKMRGKGRTYAQIAGALNLSARLVRSLCCEARRGSALLQGTK